MQCETFTLFSGCVCRIEYWQHQFDVFTRQQFYTSFSALVSTIRFGPSVLPVANIWQYSVSSQQLELVNKAADRSNRWFLYEQELDCGALSVDANSTSKRANYWNIWRLKPIILKITGKARANYAFVFYSQKMIFDRKSVI